MMSDTAVFYLGKQLSVAGIPPENPTMRGGCANHKTTAAFEHIMYKLKNSL